MNKETKKPRIAIVGPGSIGLDLMYKIKKNNKFEIAFVVGRNKNSEGIKIARNEGVEVSYDGIEFIKEHIDYFDLVFDATSAISHSYHNKTFSEHNKFAIDLTPAKIGKLCVPAINLDETKNAQNVNLITCGGQSSLPIAWAISKFSQYIDYIEVVSTIAAKSAGLATRQNIDEYITTTECALKKFSGAQTVKAILNINPAKPEIYMQTTLYVKAKYDCFSKISEEIKKIIKSVQSYIPGYQLEYEPIIRNDEIIINVSVRGSGDYLPSYAGNLDIINCAAISVAEYKLNLKNEICL
ncbi:acetaldehyde dehydrogenase (acetylating) [Xenorhabdus ishibashii]|uniref:Acetaldehyde dehydrogenase n=1 Tax=Xenorhabdus ishibashii TaxID=1034471 RepID=A0A2D0KHX4_9GAMM|nr:acetaldehyde dehydrogenase (acetylating) [Xenorhabdus ishibashii]PHM62992.1 acetaldehyde dehydrogenase [Xenorhabdus ishibashii]